MKYIFQKEWFEVETSLIEKIISTNSKILLEKLIFLLEEEFKKEEEIMKRLQFFGLEEHKKEHQKIINTLIKIKSSKDFAKKLKKEFLPLFKTHIQKMDKFTYKNLQLLFTTENSL